MRSFIPTQELGHLILAQAFLFQSGAQLLKHSLDAAVERLLFDTEPTGDGGDAQAVPVAQAEDHLLLRRP
jgi:hypothetical protein